MYHRQGIYTNLQAVLHAEELDCSAIPAIAGRAIGTKAMKEHGHDFSDEGGLRKFRTEIPNTVIRGVKSRGLSVHAKWLYVYFKSVCGDGTECYRTTSTIAEESGLSRTMVSTAKRELAAKGLIILTKSKNPNRQPDHVHIKNIWDMNMQEFSVPLANALHELDNKEKQAHETHSVPLANAEGMQRSISERSVPLANASVLLANQRRSLEEDPSKKEDPPSLTLPPPPDGGVETRERVCDTQAIEHLEATFTPRIPYTTGFLRLREVYPSGRLEGEHEAFQTWQARDLEPRTAEIVDKVVRLTQTLWLTRERRYIPLLKTWLDKGRYDDPLVPLEVAPEPGQTQDYHASRKAREQDVEQRFLEKYHARSRGPAGLSGGDETIIDDVQYRADR